MKEIADTAAQAFGALVAKFLPAFLGAAIMVAVAPPRTKRELFGRAFVAFAFSFLVGDVVLEGLRQVPWLSFLDAANRKHTVAVDGLVGACGWWVASGAAVWLERFRADPKLPGLKG